VSSNALSTRRTRTTESAIPLHLRSRLPPNPFIPSIPPPSHTSLPIPARPRQPQHEIHHDRGQQRHRQHRRPEAIVEATLAPHADALGAPVEGHEGVQHGGQGDEGEEARGDLADAVAEVEQADGQTAEDDGEVEPGEEGAFVGKEDFGFDAGGEGDALAFGGSGLEGVGCVKWMGWRDGWMEVHVPGAVWRSGWLDMVVVVDPVYALGQCNAPHGSCIRSVFAVAGESNSFKCSLQ